MTVVARERWQEELVGSIRTLEQLQAVYPAIDPQKLQPVLGSMRLAITPHSASLINWNDAHDPLLRMALPSEEELTLAPEELRDPIGDEAHSPVPFLTHRYPDRVLLTPTFACSQYCRFCFRRFKTGSAASGPSPADLEAVASYLRQHPEVDEVILSGGDPLTLVDAQLDGLLGSLRAVETVRRIRIHTRVPVNLPSRITPALVGILRRHTTATRPVYVVTHFNHPREIAPDNVEAVSSLIDAGIVVKNQSVLLAGVNDSAETLTALFKTLADIRVQPYYIHQLDLAKGTSHFRVPLEKGMALMAELQGAVTGLALPRYMMEIPGGKGKIPLSRQRLEKNADGTYTAYSWKGEAVTYVEPTASTPEKGSQA